MEKPVETARKETDMRMKKILCTLLAISMLSVSVDATAFAAESTTAQAGEMLEQTEERQTEQEPVESVLENDFTSETERSTEDVSSAEEDSFMEEHSTLEENSTMDEESAVEETATEEETVTDEEAAETEAVILNDNLSIEAANGLGNLLMDELEIAAQEGQSEAQAGYAVSEIEMSGSTASVSLHASGTCTVVVGIYKENDTKPLAFGSTLVEVGENKVSVPIEIDNMPDYFVIKGYLVETGSLRPLSREYVSNMYTQAMQEFLAKKTTDFDADKVLNLDDDEKTNFAVVSEGNILIKAFEDGNGIIVNDLINYDDTTKTYTFANIDETVEKLQQDDIFTYQNETSQEETDIIFAIKVQSIEIRESTDKGTIAVIIASDEELKANDVFEYIKIEETATNADASEIDENSCPKGVEYLGRNTAVGYALTNEDNPFSVSDTWALDLKEFGNDDDDDDKILDGDFSGSIELQLSFAVEVKYYYSAVSNIAYVDISIPISFGIQGECELSGKLAVPLVKTAVPEIKTKLITVTYVPKFVASISLKGEFEVNLAGEFGLCAGWGADNTGPRAQAPEIKGDIEIEVDGYLGIDFNPSLKVASGAIIDAKLESGAHVGITASNSLSELHDCGLFCFSGSIYWEIPFTAEFKILKIELTDIEGNDPTDLKSTLEIGGSAIFNKKHKLGEFYFCAQHEKKIILGTCPYVNSAVKVTVTVRDSAGNPVQGAVVSTSEQTYTEKTNADGVIEIEVQEGEQHFFAAYMDTEEKSSHIGSITYDVKKDERTKPVITLGTMKASLPRSQKVAEFKSAYAYQGGYVGYWMARMEDGSLYTWGANDNGVVGNGSTTCCSNPVKVLEQVKEIEVDQDHSIRCVAAITFDGELYMWGSNYYGQLGLGKTKEELPNVTVPTIVPLPGGVRKVAIANGAVAAITVNNELFMWGNDNYGRLGTDDVDDKNNSINENLNTPKKIMDGIVDVKISRYNTMALTTDGTVYIWGDYHNDRLGDGTIQYRYATDLENPIMTDAKNIALSDNNAAVIAKDGSLYMWGVNNYGQLGINSTEISHEIVRTTNISNVDEIMFLRGYGSVAAITTNGDLYMWGDNRYGQLGDGTKENKTSPYKIKSLQNVSHVINPGSSDWNTTTAVTKNCDIWQWGKGYSEKEPEKLLQNAKLFSSECGKSYIAMTDGSLWKSSYANINMNLTFNPILDASYTLSQNVYALDSRDFTDNTAVTRVAAYALSDYKSPKTFTGLVPGERYNFYAMKSRTASAPLENYNMLSIAQGTADKNGELTIDFKLREDYGTPDLFVVGQTQISLSESLEKIEVTNIENLTYNGADQYVNPIVTFDGKQLTEGTDYYLSGDYKAKDIGSYTVIIVGTGIYSGAVAVDYQITPILRTITFDSDGGSEIESQLVEDGQFAVEPEPPVKDKYRFLGWYFNGRAYNFATTKVAQDITLTARWEALSQLSAPTSDIPSESAVNIGRKVTLRCQTSDTVIYYTTDGTDPTKESQVYQEPIIITGSMTIKAFASKEGWLDSDIVSFTYTVTGYIITFDSDGGNLVESQSVEDGQTVVEPDIPVKEGCRFIGWYLDGELYDFTSKVTKDITLTAHWEELAVLSAPVSNIPSGSTVPSGTGIILTCAEPDAVIYYTTDGNEPTRQSESYQNPIRLTDDTTIKAFASKEGFRDSEIISFSYKISEEPNDSDDSETVLPDDIPDGGIPDGLWITGIQQFYPYSGTAVKPDPRVYHGSKRLQAGRDYTISYRNNIKASDTATIIVKGKGNYGGTETKTFQITPLDLGDSRIEAEDIFAAYNKKVQKPVPVVTFNGKKLVKNKDFTISYVSVDKGVSGANQEIGTYEIRLDAKPNGNFTGSRTIQFVVSDKTLISKVKVSKIADQSYNNGAELKPALTVTMNGKTLTEGQDYMVTYQNNTEIGTAAAILSGIGDYAGTKKITFKITGKSIAKAVVSGLDSSIYSGAAQEPRVTVTLNGAALAEGVNYQVRYMNNIKAGKATVIITGINDCTGTLKKTFQIQPLDLTSQQIGGLEEAVTVKYVKGGAKPSPTLTYNNIVLKAGTDYTISYRNHKKPATQSDAKAPTFTIKGKGNFKGAISKQFTITAKPLNDLESPVSISAPDVGYVNKAGKFMSRIVLTDADGTPLVSGKDYYNIVYSRQEGENETILTKQDKPEAGTVIHVKVTGTGAYAGGELETSYKIAASDFSKAKITIKPQEYTGGAVYLSQEAIQSVKVGGADLTAQYGTSYEIVPESYTNNVKKGTASVAVRGTGSYGGTKIVKFKITERKFGGFLWFWK